MSSSTPKPAKGKFINAFQSIQMINDYVEPVPPKPVPPKVFTPPPQLQPPPLIDPQPLPQNNAPPLPLPPPAPPFNPPLIMPPFTDQFPMPPMPPPFPGGPPNQPIFPPQLAEAVVSLATSTATSTNLQDEIAKFVSETNSIESMQNKDVDDKLETGGSGGGGDELYNPLEDMDEGSDIDESEMVMGGNSPNTTRQATFNSTHKDPEDLDSSHLMSSFDISDVDTSIYPSNTIIELPSTFELPNFTVSSPSVSSGDEEDTFDEKRRSSFNRSDMNSADEKSMTATSINETGMTSKNETAITSMNETGMTSINDTGATSMDKTDMTSMDETGTTSVKETGMTSMNETGMTSMNETGTSVNETGMTSMNETGMTSMNETGMTSMNTTDKPSFNDQSRRDDEDSADDNVSDVDSEDEDAIVSERHDKEGTRKKLSERDIDLAIDLITDGKKDFDHNLDKVSDDDLDEDEDEDELDEARDMFIEAHVERSNPTRSTSPTEITTTTSKETLDYTVENKISSVDVQKSPAAKMYSTGLQDISDNEFTDKEDEEQYGQYEKAEVGKKSVDDHDELLGTALAELEAEEKEFEAEQLKKKLTKVKGAMDKVKKKKKKKEKKKEKKKTKNKDKDKGEKKEKDGSTKEDKKKKKKKKEKKKDKKDKDKTGDGAAKDKKDKKKKKKSEKKSKDEKRISEISISSVIKEINKEAKEKEKSKSDSKKSKSSKSKEDISSKSSSKDKKKDDKKKSRDKKDEKRDKSDKLDKDRKLNDRSNSTTERVKDKKDKKDKKKGKENKENKESKDKSRKGKKRSSRESSIEEDSKKRSKKDSDRKKRSSKDDSKKRRGSKRSSAARDDSPAGDDMERTRRSSHSESRKSVASERDLKSVSPPHEVDYHVGIPSRDTRKKSSSPPVLSMSEFYEIQNKVRQLREEERGKDGAEDSTRKIRENLEESRKFRESIENSHKPKDGVKRPPKENKPSDNSETLKRLRENLAEIHNFRKKMTDTSKMRDSLEERKLRNNLMQETKKLQEAIKQRTGALSDSDGIEILEEAVDSKKGIKKLDSVQKTGKSLDSKSSNKKSLFDEEAAAKKILEDNKQTRTMLREDYNRELDKYREQHEQKLKLRKEQQKKRLQKKQNIITVQSDVSQDDQDTGTISSIPPKSPPSPPPPPQKRTRSESDQTLSNHSQTISYTLPSPTGSGGMDHLDQQPCTPENIINEIEQADMFVEEQQQMEEQMQAEQNIMEHDIQETGESLEIDLNNEALSPHGSEEEMESGESDTERKPGTMSIRQYKRRKTGEKRQRGKSTSSNDADDNKEEETTSKTGVSYVPEEAQDEDAPLEQAERGEEANDDEGTVLSFDGEPDVDETRVRERTIHSPMTEEQNQEELERLVASPSPTPADVPEVAEEPLNTSTVEEEAAKDTISAEEVAEVADTVNIRAIDSNSIPLLSSEDVVHDKPSQAEEEDQPTASPESQTAQDKDLSYNPELASTWKEISDAEAEAGPGDIPYNPNSQLDTSWNENNGAANDSDAEVVPSPIESEDSPYNPEFASPFDMGSPIDMGETTRPDQNIDFRAYKDVVAFNDIMKSKVKQQARKSKRKKLADEVNVTIRAGRKERKLVDHLIRQSQVEEEMKNVLKQYFKSRDITKEEYKNILKKAVPQVTMSNSPIIPDKIQSLMVKFVRKCKGQRMQQDKRRRRHEREQERDLAEQQKELQLQLAANAAMLDSLQQPLEQLHALNPNLPLPPI